MTWLFILLAMAVIALAAGVVTGRIAGSMESPATSLPFRGLPDDVVPADLEALRFDAALRGYRMDQVDAVIDRLADELRRRDDELALLRAAAAGGSGTTPEPGTASVPGTDASVPGTDASVPGTDAAETGTDAAETGDEVPAGVEGRGVPASDQG